jgi:hypothetical protein
MTLVLRRDIPVPVPHADGKYGAFYHDAYGRLWMHVGELPHWVSSGAKTSSGVIKASSGVLGGVLVIATDDGGDIVVNVYNNPAIAGDTLLATVCVTTTTAGAQASFGALSSGIIAENGIYLEVESGDCTVIVYYS